MTGGFFRDRRFRNFRRIRRAWWSLWAFVAISLFCLFAEWVAPCDPNAVTDAASLEPYRIRETVRTYDVRTARFSVDASGAAYDWEGPEDLRERFAGLSTDALAAAGEAAGYRVTVTPRGDHSRVWMEPRERPVATEETLSPKPVAFPFPPCPGHPFGLDAAGRDVFSRVVHGLRIALAFGLVLTFSGMLAGLVAGAVEGYFGGWADIALQRFTEIWSAMPFLYVMIFIGSSVGRGFAVLLACYAAFNWITVSYYVRAEFLRLRARTFVEAAKTQGLSPARIIFVHILPNALTPLVTLFPFLLMGAIGSLAALDFLGFGLPPMTPSCGELLQEAQQFRDAWWLILFPSLALFAVMLLTVLVGEGLRDAFDPRERARLE